MIKAQLVLLNRASSTNHLQYSYIDLKFKYQSFHFQKHYTLWRIVIRFTDQQKVSKERNEDVGG